ncbi:manganese efflux pump MntP [Sporosarcina gallistercoris]|uniref:Manganese efflux pump n=1 Tax=Sporosarcina gallistercoris TaxID=2762245 RepID=A0ABR8PLZ7_9BACL|nr:manganese efflux pump [Sporosarcina gallistercoris]MBD7909179.1 manganese efflux pump [Sporosarcina gallistercoris]
MVEIIAASVTTIDILVIYTLLHVRKRKWLIALWTAFLNVAFPLLGFMAGELSAQLFSEWSGILSSILLALIGLHMILQEEDPNDTKVTGPLLIAVAVSLDSFSVSMSFGLMHLNKWLFIVSTGVMSLVLSYFALRTNLTMTRNSRKNLRRFAGIVLMGMGILSWIS